MLQNHCPEDFAGYFSQENPPIQQASIGWSNRMHQDPSADNVFLVMDEAFRYIVDESSLEPHSARLAASEIVRGAVVRVMAHRLGMNMAPLAAEFLEGNDEVVVSTLQDPLVRAFKQPRAGIRTDFARVWFGDDARLLLTTGLLMQSFAQETIDQLPSGIRAGTLRAGIWVTRAAHDVIEHRGLQEKRLAPLTRPTWSEEPRGQFVIRSDAERGRWQERFLLDALANGPKMDAATFLFHNTEAATEHVVAFITDVIHGFQAYEHTEDDWVRSVVRRLHMVPTLAFMGNQQNAEAEYRDRYVEAAPGNGVPVREPLVTIAPNGINYDIVPNQESAYANATRGKRNRCPGPDAIEPQGKEVEASERLRYAMKSIIREYDPLALHMLDRHFSEPDVIAVTGIAVARSLVRAGFASFDAKDVSRQLRLPDKATSTGAYIFAS